MSVVAQDVVSDYFVADLTQAEFGRKEIAIAETEMPGLMATQGAVHRGPAAEGRPDRRFPSHDDPDGGAHRDAGGALGADVRWCLVQYLSPRRITRRPRLPTAGVPVFAWTRGRRWRNTGSARWMRIMEWSGRRQGPEMIVDDGGDATLLMITRARIWRRAIPHGAGRSGRLRGRSACCMQGACSSGWTCRGSGSSGRQYT